MARNAHTSHTAGSTTGARQYVLPWSPAEQTSPVDVHGGDDVRSQREINGSTAPSHSDMSPAPIPVETNPKPAVPKPKESLTLRAGVERLLRDRAIPYVNVDEAKRALFASAKLRAFHFVAYRKDGPNWLIFAARADRRARDTMAEWERVFGEGFTAVLASAEAAGEAGGGIRFRSLDGRRVEFDEVPTQGQSRPALDRDVPG